MSDQLTLAMLAALSGGRVEQGEPDTAVADVVVDSRGVLPRGSLFVALKGENFDGHSFVDEALAKGAIAAMVESSRADAWCDSDAGIIAVDDTTEALQELARGWRERFRGTIVGITGSNGKTIVKEMLSAIVSREKTVHRSPGSYNSQIGVPLSLLGLRDEHDVGIIEAGISQLGEMERLQRMIEPDIGVVTMIGRAHAAGLHDRETTATEKLKLFDEVGEGPVIVPADDATLRAKTMPGRIVRFAVRDEESEGDSPRPDVSIRSVASAGPGFSFTVDFPDGTTHEMRLNVPGRHNLHNAAAAIATALELGIGVEAIRDGLASFALSPMRLEMHTTQSGVTLLNDAYSSDPVSARSALNALRHYAGRQRTFAIIGDMLDLGSRAEKAHRELGEVVARLGIDRLICVGDLAALVGEGALAHGMSDVAVESCPDLEALERHLARTLEPGDFVLFKGSRAVGLERAARTLVESMAAERLYVDLDAIRQNFQAIRRRLGPDREIMAVVKSFGYGNDSTRVSQTLVQEGVDALAVAYPDEAIPLRHRGIEVPVLVTNVLADEADKVVKYGLTALVYSRPVIDALQTHAERQDREVGVHIEVDTGMNRVGLEPDDVLDFARELRRRPNLRLEGVMTHFAAADDRTEDAFTRRQISRFETVLDELESAGIDPGVVHAANTAAVWRFPDAGFDMVRVGLGLYGLHPSEDVGEAANGTRPALRFTTQVIHVKEIEPGETVSYGRTWRAESRRRIASIAIGYNDGFPRFMSNGGEVLVRGQRCTVVGTVCMDVTMVDVTDVPGVEVGDEVVIFGVQDSEEIAVEELAERGGTINYEILCNISPRVRRIFVDGTS